VVCWIKRAKKIGRTIPMTKKFEEELMKELQAKTHEELEKSINFLHDETFDAIIESIINKIKYTSKEKKDKIADIYI